jgi:tRNA/tmRNA/rRNA uracil-C5-methylase (TrmA/RlmC/RlmD family)
MGTNAEYVSAMQAQMKRWDEEVDILASEGRKASGELRTAFARRLKELRLNRTAAQKAFQEVRDATEAASAKLQAGMQAAWETLQNSLEKVSAELRK